MINDAIYKKKIEMKLINRIDECGCQNQEKISLDTHEDEGAQYKGKLKKIIENTYLIHEIIEKFDDLPSWVQDKITIANHNMDAILNYLENELEMHYSYEMVKEKPEFSSVYDHNQTMALNEAEYRGRKVKLGKPFRTPGGPKKFSVYVKNKSGNVIKVNFGDPNLRIKNKSASRAKSFRARHKCDQKKDRTTPGYWSCNVARYRKALGLTSSRTW